MLEPLRRVTCFKHVMGLCKTVGPLCALFYLISIGMMFVPFLLWFLCAPQISDSKQWISGDVTWRETAKSNTTSLSFHTGPSTCCAALAPPGVENVTFKCVNFSDSANLPGWTTHVSDADSFPVSYSIMVMMFALPVGAIYGISAACLWPGVDFDVNGYAHCLCLRCLVFVCTTILFYAAGIFVTLLVVVFFVLGRDVTFLETCITEAYRYRRPKITDDVILQLSQNLTFQWRYYCCCIVAMLLLVTPLLAFCPCFLCRPDFWQMRERKKRSNRQSPGRAARRSAGPQDARSQSKCCAALSSAKKRFANLRSGYWESLRSAFRAVKFRTLDVRFARTKPHPQSQGTRTHEMTKCQRQSDPTHIHQMTKPTPQSNRLQSSGPTQIRSKPERNPERKGQDKEREPEAGICVLTVEEPQLVWQGQISTETFI